MLRRSATCSATSDSVSMKATATAREAIDAARRGPDAAIVGAGGALAVLPGAAVARALGAKCLILGGEAPAARRAAAAAAQYVGSSPVALDAVGSVLGMLGEHARAAELFGRA